MIQPEFLDMLRCPISRQPLALADAELIARLNEVIEAGQLLNRLGEPVRLPLDSGLLSESESLLFPIHDEIPCLLIDEAIELAQLSSSDT